MKNLENHLALFATALFMLLVAEQLGPFAPIIVAGSFFLMAYLAFYYFAFIGKIGTLSIIAKINKAKKA